MWGPIIEKAWAKAAGNYINSDGGQLVNALRFLTGAPVFNFIHEKDFTVAEDKEKVFPMLMDAYEKKYLMNAGTFGGDDSDVNECGISKGHAFSILAAFTMTDAEGADYNMLLIRDPYGEVEYSEGWNANDARWNDDLVD